MPDEIEPEEEGALPDLDLEKLRSDENRVNEVRLSVENIQQQNWAAIDAASAKLSIITSNLPDFRLPHGLLNLLRCDALFASSLPQGPLIPPEFLSGYPSSTQISQIASSFAVLDLGLKSAIADIGRLVDALRTPIPELLRSIQFAFPPPDPRLSDVVSAMDGDPAAAKRVAQRIEWNPGEIHAQCIRIKSRVEGESPEEVRRKALIQGVLRALSGEKDEGVPILIGPESAWLYDDEQNLATIAPFQQLPMDYFWKWLDQEAARAAGLWLVGLPYAPSIILEVLPDGSSDWQFAKFTSLVTDQPTRDTRRGRPYGSGIFGDGMAFLAELKLASNQVESRGNRVTEERVAEVLSERGLMGNGSPERQLRRWVKEFGYADWSDLKKSL